MTDGTYFQTQVALILNAVLLAKDLANKTLNSWTRHFSPELRGEISSLSSNAV